MTSPKTDIASRAAPKGDDVNAMCAPLNSLKGLGPRGEELLTKLLAKPLSPPRVADLLWHLPSGYLDRRLTASILEAAPGAVTTLVVTPVRYNAPPKGAARAPLRIVCEDESASLDVVFFHGDRAAIRRLLPLNEIRIVSGRVERYGTRLQMAHPDFILAPSERGKLPAIEPIYPLTLGLTQKFLYRLMGDALSRAPDAPEWLEASLVEQEGWPSFWRALHILHRPQSPADLALWPKARERLAFDEVFSAQLAISLVRRSYRQLSGRSLPGDGCLAQRMRNALPYSLTRSQEQALAEIKADMLASRRMLRLLQGDVGSGKTVVAALAMSAAVEAGAQAAMMAPTDVLARQHLETLKPLCEAAGIRLGYLSGREQGKTRALLLDQLATGKIQILVGTHALFQPDVAFHDLGLAVVDEQHRFGVAQRLALQEKARAGDADILVMTATPIPRTLLLSLHGDLDVSQLIEKPAGRKPVLTRTVPQERLEDIIEGLHRALREGAQVYWVCPAVDSETARDMTSAEERAAHLRQIFGERVGLVHGRLSGADKDAAIAAFAARETSILVATTVIEVGVNVPAATVMIIENAEMFGLAQLHQLRGRVGRGAAQSSCVLLYEGPLSETAKSRLDILRQVEDGFVIAEEDLRLRGGGEVLGPRQSGDPGFRIAQWPQAAPLVDRASDLARYLLHRDPYLESEQGLAARRCLILFERDDAMRLLQAG
ncbi:MAG TPA: ATP-dependent DNA helicase RecG [Rhodomicrobium sp.]|nr:ATP-dependent DNA helicase RecG [Rhodomicrobium sp.]